MKPECLIGSSEEDPLLSVLGGLIIILGISSYATVVGLRNGFHGGPFRVREGRVFVWPAEAPPEGKIPKWGVV